MVIQFWNKRKYRKPSDLPQTTCFHAFLRIFLILILGSSHTITSYFPCISFCWSSWDFNERQVIDLALLLAVFKAGKR